jgi:hypothetical protein
MVDGRAGARLASVSGGRDKITRDVTGPRHDAIMLS